MNLDSYIGQSIEVEDSSAMYQCMDWAFKVCDLRGINRAEIRNPAAKDVWTHHGASLEEHTDPQPLDFAIFGTKVGPYGHICVVKDGTRSSFRSWDQNWNSKNHVTLETHSSNGLLGFLRLKGGDMPITSGQVDKLIKMSLNREPTAAELGNVDYQNNPGLAIDTFWNNGGEAVYKNPPATSVKPYDGPALYLKK